MLRTKAPSEEGAVAKRLRERKNSAFSGILSPSHGYAVPAPSSEGAFWVRSNLIDKSEFEMLIGYCLEKCCCNLMG